MKKEVLKSEIIWTIPQLKRLANKMKQLEEFAFDTETNTLRVFGNNSQFKCVGISISWGAYNNYYIPMNHYFETGQLPVSTVVKYLKPIFENPEITIIGQNLKFDMHVLARIGINIKTNHLIDTMILSWICDENAPKGLKENSQRILGVDQTHFADVLSTVTSEQKKAVGLKANNKATYDLISVENGAPYALADSYYTFELYKYFLCELEKEGMEKIYFKTYPQFLRTIYNMEERGITVDVPKLKQMGIDMEKDLDNLTYEMLELAGVHVELGSTQQLAQLIYGYSDFKNVNESILKASFNFPIGTTTAKGVPQVNNANIEKLAKSTYKTARKREGVEFCKKLLEYKKLAKLKSAFVDGLLEQIYEDGKAHPSFQIVGCLTEETLIPTTDGLKPIGLINKSLVDDSPVDTKLTILNRHRELEDTRYIVKFEKEKTVEIKTTLGLSIEGSEVHPIITSKYHPIRNSHHYRKYLGTPEQETWTKLSDIEIGDKVAIPFNYNLFSQEYVKLQYTELEHKYNHKEVLLPPYLTEELAEFMGIYYADGSIHSANGTFSIRITNGNQDVINRVSYLVKKLFGISVSVCDEPKKNSATVYITAKHLAPIEKALDLKRGCVNKVVPQCILDSPKSVIQSFIRGLTLDSCVITESKHKNYLKFTFSNEISARYIQEILLNMGIISSRRQDLSKTDNVFHVYIYNGEYVKFRDEIGFIETCKIINIELNPNISSNYTVTNGNTIWVTVKSKSHGLKDVYDFNVPNTHSFISGAFISHNTDSGRISCSSPNLKCIGSLNSNI